MMEGQVPKVSTELIDGRLNKLTFKVGDYKGEWLKLLECITSFRNQLELFIFL